jgi:hypothetical protein
VAAERNAVLGRAAFGFQDWMGALAALADVEARMLGELGRASLVTTIAGPWQGAAAGGTDRFVADFETFANRLRS